DHPVLGLRLPVRQYGGDDCSVFLRRGAARGRALHRMRLDPAVAGGPAEEFRRTREDDGPAEIDQRAVMNRLAGDERPEGGARIAAPAAGDRHGQVRLIDVAAAQVIVQAVEALPVGVEIPAGAGYGQEGFV